MLQYTELLSVNEQETQKNMNRSIHELSAPMDEQKDEDNVHDKKHLNATNYHKKCEVDFAKQRKNQKAIALSLNLHIKIQKYATLG